MNRSKQVGGGRKINIKVGRCDLNPTPNIFLSCFLPPEEFVFVHFKC